MSMTEKYRPKTEKELIGNEKAIKAFKAALKKEEHCVLQGEPGIGKTSSVYALAADQGYAVYEVNASDERKKADLESLYGRVQSKSFRKLLYLFDEVDGLKDWSILEKIVSHSIHPIILVANDAWKIPKKIRDLCTEIRFYKPRPREVLKRMQHIAKKEGVEPDYSGIGEDVRSSINATFYGGERRIFIDQFTKIDNLLRGRGKVEDINKDDLIWILDNLHNYYAGRDLFKAIKVLELASRTKLDVLKDLPKGSGRVQYPYYLRRLKVVKYRKK